MGLLSIAGSVKRAFFESNELSLKTTNPVFLDDFMSLANLQTVNFPAASAGNVPLIVGPASVLSQDFVGAIGFHRSAALVNANFNRGNSIVFFPCPILAGVGMGFEVGLKLETHAAVQGAIKVMGFTSINPATINSAVLMPTVLSSETSPAWTQNLTPWSGLYYVADQNNVSAFFSRNNTNNNQSGLIQASTIGTNPVAVGAFWETASRVRCYVRTTTPGTVAAGTTLFSGTFAATLETVSPRTTQYGFIQVIDAYPEEASGGTNVNALSALQLASFDYFAIYGRRR